MKDFRPLKRGDPSISHEHINALTAELKRLRKIEASDAIVDNGPGGVYIGGKPAKPAFYARLTSPYGGGAYSWIEVERSAIGTFTDLQYGRVDDGLNPAVHTNLVADLPTDATHGTGAYVWLELGYGMPIEGGVFQEWLFRDVLPASAPPSGVTPFSGAFLRPKDDATGYGGSGVHKWTVEFQTEAFLVPGGDDDYIRFAPGGGFGQDVYAAHFCLTWYMQNYPFIPGEGGFTVFLFDIDGIPTTHGLWSYPCPSDVAHIGEFWTLSGSVKLTRGFTARFQWEHSTRNNWNLFEEMSFLNIYRVGRYPDAAPGRVSRPTPEQLRSRLNLP